ncbi:MAG: hypothetical protein KJ583_00640 [Nanoarchaeota archaeon]|nr:hypothetical protein [Nanoarchaeota archaeon]MBU1269670.1 hypothetical protein [Nanoarchaeota archaeon]MBU1603796.1 hypothetical protein [Nanoarchaeota archaeon]MBU2443747.1 hypothetical protein [Nanoarchaeota archaeon]
MTRGINPIYSGKRKDFNWAGFGSGKGTNIRECAKLMKPSLIFSDRPEAELLTLEELAGVPKIVLDGFKACGSWKKAVGKPEVEKEYKKKSFDYNFQILQVFKEFEDTEGISIDLIVLGGYMRLLGSPILNAYKDKIINVHPADLSILSEKHKRLYIGEDAVKDAILAGKNNTRSSVIIVDEKTDHGEILVQGPSLENYRFLHKPMTLEQYSLEHQQAQKEVSDWPALTTALDMIADSRLALGKNKYFFNEWRRVYLDGKPLGYQGYQLLEDEK